MTRLRHLRPRSGFTYLLVGQAVSGLGDWIATVALMALVDDITGSTAAVGGILLLRILPGAIAAPVGTRLARRFGARRTMLGSDLARAAMVLAIPFVTELWWVYTWAFLVEAVGLIFLPARDASIPELVAGTDHSAAGADSLVLATSYGSIPLGAGIFALVAAILPSDASATIAGLAYIVVFVFDAATYLVSFEAIRHISELRGGALNVRDPQASSRGAFVQGFKIPLVRAVIVPLLAIVGGLGALFSSGLVFVQDVLRASDVQFGILVALFGVGAFGGLGIVQILKSDLFRGIRLGVTAVGVTVAVISVAPGLTLADIGAVGFGAGTAYSFVAGMTLLQNRLDGYDRVNAFATFHIGLRVGIAVGAGVAGAIGAVIESVTVPVFGTVDVSRAILLTAAFIVFLSTTAIRDPAEHQPKASAMRETPSTSSSSPSA